jgi:hypothetical protein
MQLTDTVRTDTDRKGMDLMGTVRTDMLRMGADSVGRGCERLIGTGDCTES